MLGAGKVTGDAIRQQEIDCLALMDEVWLWGGHLCEHQILAEIRGAAPVPSVSHS